MGNQKREVRSAFCKKALMLCMVWLSLAAACILFFDSSRLVENRISFLRRYSSGKHLPMTGAAGGGCAVPWRDCGPMITTLPHPVSSGGLGEAVECHGETSERWDSCWRISTFAAGP